MVLEPQSSRRNLSVIGNCYWGERALLQYLSIVSMVRAQLNDLFQSFVAPQTVYSSRLFLRRDVSLSRSRGLI